jgi:hypothetical protein
MRTRPEQPVPPSIAANGQRHRKFIRRPRNTLDDETCCHENPSRLKVVLCSASSVFLAQSKHPISSRRRHRRAHYPFTIWETPSFPSELPIRLTYPFSFAWRNLSSAPPLPGITPRLNLDRRASQNRRLPTEPDNLRTPTITPCTSPPCPNQPECVPACVRRVCH